MKEMMKPYLGNMTLCWLCGSFISDFGIYIYNHFQYPCKLGTLYAKSYIYIYERHLPQNALFHCIEKSSNVPKSWYENYRLPMCIDININIVLV